MRLIEFCERAYYLRYVAKDGGDATVAGAKPLSFYKKLNTETGWLRGILLSSLEAALSDAALRQDRLSTENLRGIAMRFAARDAWSIRRQAWRTDCRSPCLKEAYYGVTHPAELASRGEKIVHRLADSLCGCGFVEELSSLSFSALRPVTKPESFFFEGVELWTAPDFSWTAGDGVRKIICLKLHGEDDNRAGWALRMGVNALARSVRFGDDEARMACATIFIDENEAMPVYARTCRGETERVMGDGITAALEKHRQYESDGAKAFRPSESPAKCASCAFHEICADRASC